MSNRTDQPLGLTVELTNADGLRHTLVAYNAPAQDVPQSLQFTTKRGEGFSTFSCVLRRRIDLDWPDLNLFDNVVVTTAAGTIVWEGRISRQPRSISADGQSINIEAVGHSAALRDVRMSEIYVDRNLGSWQGPSRANQVRLLADAFRIYDQQVAPDATNGAQALVGTLQLEGFKAIVQPTYDAGSGLRVARIYYDITQDGASPRTADSNWTLEAFANDRDDLTPVQDRSGQLNATTTSIAGYWVPGSPRRFVLWEFAYNTAFTNATDRKTYWRNLTVYGDQNLPLVGTTDPKGVAASDAILHIIHKYAPGLTADESTITPTTYPIPHLVFDQRIDPFDAILEINKFHLFDFAVWENRTAHWAPVDLSDYQWEIRHDDPGVTIDLQGDSTEELFNGIEVEYDDVQTGRREVLLAADHAELRDPNPENAVTLHGLTRNDNLTLSSPTTQAAALQIGRARLAEVNQPTAPGSITVTDRVRDRAGNWQPVSHMRAGDTVALTSMNFSDRPRIIQETSYDHGDQEGPKRLTVAVDSTLRTIEAFQDRLATELHAANLAN
jgi:hypothetical protein